LWRRRRCSVSASSHYANIMPRYVLCRGVFRYRRGRCLVSEGGRCLKLSVSLPTWPWRLPAPVTRFGRSPVRSSPQSAANLAHILASVGPESPIRSFAVRGRATLESRHVECDHRAWIARVKVPGCLPSTTAHVLAPRTRRGMPAIRVLSAENYSLITAVKVCSIVMSSLS
jgi:hypothetical protein